MVKIGLNQFVTIFLFFFIGIYLVVSKLIQPEINVWSLLIPLFGVFLIIIGIVLIFNLLKSNESERIKKAKKK